MEFEKAALPLFRLRRLVDLRLQFFDPRIGAHERFILQQRRLDQRVDGVRRAPGAIGDQAFGFGVTRHGFELGQTIEQPVDEFVFLGGHCGSP